jgi:hypothetical protein
MSNPGSADPVVTPESTLIQQDGAIPETVVPVEEAPETPVEAEAAPEAAPETPTEPVKPKRTPWYQQRINELSALNTKNRAAREVAEAELAALKTPSEQEAAPTFDPKQFDSIIDQRAEALVARREFERRSRSWIEAGNKEFGAADFMDKCNEVAALGAGESAEFMALITDPETIPDGHKIIAALAEHPEEAQRILSLDPVRMAAALTRFASIAKLPEKKISQAPAPIKPIGGTAKSSTPNDNEPMGEWMAKRRAEVAARGKN